MFTFGGIQQPTTKQEWAMIKLKQRGLDASRVIPGIMDGLPALEKVFREEFPRCRTQLCVVHMKCNVLAKVARKDKNEVSDDLNSIFYASSKEKALEFYRLFQEKWEKIFKTPHSDAKQLRCFAPVGSAVMLLITCLTQDKFSAHK
jgi:transposase-like protein